MIKKGTIKLSDVVFVYFGSPEQSLVGVVVKIDYPIITNAIIIPTPITNVII